MKRQVNRGKKGGRVLGSRVKGGIGNMKKASCFVGVLFFVIIFFSAFHVGFSADDGFKIISTEELKKMMESPKKPLLAFSPSPLEFAHEHIFGSTCIPLELMKNHYEMPENLDAVMVFYCLGPACVKSKLAAGLAVKMGYRKVYWYRDGLEGWKKAGYPTSYTMKFKFDPPPPIKPSALQKKMEAKEKLFLVDIRDEMSIDQFGKIDGPTLYYPLFRFHSLYWELPKKILLVIFDVRGRQAPHATRYLLQKYFDRSRVTWLEGGIEAWKKLGLPMVNTGAAKKPARRAR